MDSKGLGLTPMEFQRRPGGRTGCGCCGFFSLGLLLLPVLAVAGFFMVV